MPGRTYRRASLSAVALASLALSGCDGILDVELPGQLVDSDVFTPDNAELLVNSAIADFECAYSMMSATLTTVGEESWAGTGGWGTAHGDYATLTPGQGHCPDNSDVDTDWWHGYERARLFSEAAYQRLSEEWTDVPNRERLMATAAVYAGLVYDFLGSTFCEYAFPEESIVPPSDVLRRGEAWLTTALEVMGPDDYAITSTQSLKQLAHLVRARIRRTLGDDIGAAEDAAQIQPGFVAWVTRDGSERGRWNEVYYTQYGFRYRTVAGPRWWSDFAPDQLVSAGMWDLTIATDGTGRHTVGDGVPDVRVPEVNTHTPILDGFTPFHRQEKYTSVGDPHRMASWQEAQLILAEIERGQSAVARINAIRDVHGLPHFASSDEEEIFSAIIEERRREFFLEGARHFMDKLRFGLWFPRGRGSTRVGDRYGFAYCLVLPATAYELNPNVPADYIGPDLTDLSYTWELQVDEKPNWPVPASLPQFDVMDFDAIPWSQW